MREKKKILTPPTRYIIQTVLLGFIVIPITYFILKIIISPARPVVEPLSFSFFLVFITALFILFIQLKSILTGNTFLETLADYCTFIPFNYPEKESLIEKNFNATYALILINVFIHYGMMSLGPDAVNFVHDYLTFLPAKLSFWNLLISPLACNFFHADEAHLWGNMIFLWIFGLVLERRIGWKRLVFVYLTTGLFSSFFSVYLHLVIRQEVISSLGASGAISGLLGIFALRLFYKRMIFPVPFLGFLSILFGLNLKVRISSLALAGIYFFYDLVGAAGSFSAHGASIDYFGHIGGFLSGLYLGSKFKFPKKALEEMMVERARAAMEIKGDNREAERLLKIVLEENSDQIEALLTLARIKTKGQQKEEAKEFYLRAINLLGEKDREKATEVFSEYFSCYRDILETKKMLPLLEPLERSGKLLILIRVLEKLIDRPDVPPSLRPQLIFRLAWLYEQLEFYESARQRYEQLLKEYPDYISIELVKYRLTRLSQLPEERGFSALLKKF